ncbi:MAG TPA: BON domain-containing protein [Urbifossiella sp.]|jgi:osmotically-inducible protein OsmY|nr:BON domain-containing protein [Urbifossiella sp.]
MRQLVAVLILIALFILLVGTRFKPSDGDKLATIGQLACEKVRGALPPTVKLAGPFNALRREIPESLDDRVKARLEADDRLASVPLEVSAEGTTVTLRGVAPTARARKAAISLAEHTIGVDKVVDELAVPTE